MDSVFLCRGTRVYLPDRGGGKAPAKVSQGSIQNGLFSILDLLSGQCGGGRHCATLQRPNSSQHLSRKWKRWRYCGRLALCHSNGKPRCKLSCGILCEDRFLLNTDNRLPAYCQCAFSNIDLLGREFVRVLHLTQPVQPGNRGLRTSIVQKVYQAGCSYLLFGLDHGFRMPVFSASEPQDCGHSESARQLGM